MPIISRLLLAVLAGALIMGARVATRHCTSLQPAKAAMPLSKSLGARSGGSYSSYILSQRAAFYEKSSPRAPGRRLISL
jgi:hypothetical protein